MKKALYLMGLLCVLVCTRPARATQTENLGIRILPAPGKVTVDGNTDDWDLSGGIFISDSVETQRDKFAVWFFAMHDAKNLYILAHFTDETPLNNPGQTIGDYGFAGDCLQFRLIAHADRPDERTSHWTCWRGRDHHDVLDVVYGKKFDGGEIKDARTQGAQQAFQIDADNKGYVQEIAIPWSLVTRDGQPLKTGDPTRLTVEPNFTVGVNSRLTLKDLFKPGVTPDRVFTFMSSDKWGPATLEAKGHVAPQPVRLADAREFPVKLEHGTPVANWTGLIKSKELPGFAVVEFTMPVDGYVSLNIRNAEGNTVRQLLNAAFYTRGLHRVKWDGLTTPLWNKPGDPVPSGTYTWNALYHTGIGLKLRGWADNAGSTPWDNGPTTNWGGDEGPPIAAAADAERVYLGWGGAEAGRALIACDLKGNILWKNNRQGMAGAQLVAVDRDSVYAVNWGPNNSNYLYRLEAKTGMYLPFGSSQSPDLFPHDLWPDPKGKSDFMDGMEVRNDRIYMSFAGANAILVVDAKTGKWIKTLTVSAPYHMKAVTDTRVYVISNHGSVLTLDPTTGQTAVFLSNLHNAVGLTTDSAGNVYVGLREPDNQVRVYSPEGKFLHAIGRPGGRALTGKWTPDGMAYASGLAVDAAGQLWVAEEDGNPRRVSTWDAQTGKLRNEWFGPSDYGALGGAIDPLDPNVMVGQGCEWRLDPQTGKSAIVSVISREGMSNSRYCVGSNGRLYLFVAPQWAFEIGPVSIYERVGEGAYKLRGRFTYTGKDKDASTRYWADANGDGKEQPEEVVTVPGTLRFSAWYMNAAPDLSLSAGESLLKVTGFTPCGAPRYDLAHPIKMPISGVASADAKSVLHPGEYGASYSMFSCYDIASGQLRWTYPDTFVGVHGSHNAPPDEVGLIRGSYGPAGVATLPEPIGNIWVVPTNVGEWHILTRDGFYLTRLFQPDSLKHSWPQQAVPGADMSSVPPGMGGEDFGGSVTYGKDGKLYLLSGKTAYWNLEVTGLETVKKLNGAGSIRIGAPEINLAQTFHDQYAQAAVGRKQLTIKKKTPVFTGSLDGDFNGEDVVSYHKQEEAAVRSAIAWDDQNLYLGWDVRDPTPWTNGAGTPENMYLSGDTVDFQLGTDPNANKDRAEAVLGDLRLSIGGFQGMPTAVLYRKVAHDKHAKTFSSGVIKEYRMDSVQVVKDAVIKVSKRGDGYTVEATIPLSDLEWKPTPGTAVRGDVGATHGDAAGQRTRLRTYWNNQHTGIVDDAVFELMMEPRNWGDLTFQP